MSRSRWPAAWLLLAALVLSACVQLPRTEGVVEGRPSGQTEQQPNVAIVAAPPRGGDSPAQVAEGFIAAMASFEPGYRTARRYLTPEASGDWNPSSGVAVYDLSAGPRTVRVSPGVVRTELPLRARVGADGSYVKASPDARLRLEMRMKEVDGEWRIQTPPDGLVMSAFDFDREFSPLSIYFFAPEFNVLVADPTYLPVRANVPTLLVTSLLEGASRWLRPAVRTAVPDGTSLLRAEVPVESGVATVDLAGPISDLSSTDLDRLAAQLAWTLGQVPGITDVALLERGSPVRVPGALQDEFSTAAYSGYDPSTMPTGDTFFAVSEAGVVAADTDRVEPVRGPLGTTSDIRSLAVNRSGTVAAVVEADGRRVFTAPFTDVGERRALFVGTDLSHPSWDRNDTVWVVDRGPGRSVINAVDPDTGQFRRSEPPDRQRRTREVMVAPDGVRALALVGPARDAAVYLGLVIREDGQPPRMGRWVPIPLGFVEIRSASWSTPTGMGLLAAIDDEPLQPYQVDLADLEPVARGQVAGARWLAAAPGQPLVVATDAGEVLRQDAPLEWSPVTMARVPTYPG